MTSRPRSNPASLLLLIACIASCEALHVPTPRSARRRTPSTFSMADHRHRRLRMTTDRPSCEMRAASSDDEPFDSRRHRERSRLSELARTNADDTSRRRRRRGDRASPIVAVPESSTSDFSSPTRSETQRVAARGLRRSDLPLEDLLSDARRLSLLAELESSAREASLREGTIRAKLSEMGRLAWAAAATIGDENAFDLVKAGGHGNVGDGIVPTAAGSGGSAAFRRGAIGRERKEAGARRGGAKRPNDITATEGKRDGGILGRVMGGVAAASLGALAVSAGTAYAFDAIDDGSVDAKGVDQSPAAVATTPPVVPASGFAPAAKPGGEKNLYARYDGPTRKEASAPNGPDSSPNLRVVMERDPSPGNDGAPPPPRELTVKLERSVPKQVDPPAPAEDQNPAQEITEVPPTSSGVDAEPEDTRGDIDEDGRTPKRESILSEALEYIKEYNVQNNAAEKDPTNNAAATSTKFSDTLSEDPPLTATGSTSSVAAAISGVINNAKVFSVGVAVGTVALITQQKRVEKSPSSSVATTFHYSDLAAEVDTPPNNPSSMYENAIDIEAAEDRDTRPPPGAQRSSYLDSLSIASRGVGATGTQQSYLDGLSGSSPLSLPIDERVVETRGVSYLESLNAGGSSVASEETGSSYLGSSLGAAAPPLFGTQPPTREISASAFDGTSSSETVSSVSDAAVSDYREEQYAANIDDATNNVGGTSSNLDSSEASLKLDNVASSPVEVVLDGADGERYRGVRVFVESSVRVTQSSGETTTEETGLCEGSSISITESTFESPPPRPKLR